MESVSLSAYLGNCQVIEVDIDRGSRIYPSDLMQKINAPRVLLKTNSFPDPNHWNSDFNACSAELIEHLHKNGVILVGIDTPSVDPSDDKALESHNKIYDSKMAILEGIVLTGVETGNYQLIALPLPIMEADASPVRAILIKEKK
jgi:arylformamidase